MISRFLLAAAVFVPCLGAAAQSQKVVITRPQVKDVVITLQFVGKLLAHRHENVRAPVTGTIAQVLVKEGQPVKKGDVLYKIESTISELKLNAELADLKLAQLELQRSKKRLEQKKSSTEEVGVREAKVASVNALVKLAQAEVDSTTVRTPFDGLVGRLQEQEGSVVKEGGILTTLFEDKTMSVEFQMSESRYLDFMSEPKAIKEGILVELTLANGTKYPQKGKFDSLEKPSKNDLGRMALRAEFPNPNHLLRHGQAGNVFLRQTLKKAVVIPQRATFEVGPKRFVFVIEKDEVAHRREILVQCELDQQFVVKKGLEGSERIVLEGVRNIHEEQKVKGVFQEP